MSELKNYWTGAIKETSSLWKKSFTFPLFLTSFFVVKKLVDKRKRWSKRLRALQNNRRSYLISRGSAIFLLLLNIISISSEENPKIEQHRIWNDDGGEEDDDVDLIGQVGSTDCSVQSWGARLCSTFQTPGLPHMYKVFFFHWASTSTENLG